MKLLYLDCFAGISGDMFLGALLDLGVSEETLRSRVVEAQTARVYDFDAAGVKQNISATKFDCIEVDATGRRYKRIPTAGTRRLSG